MLLLKFQGGGTVAHLMLDLWPSLHLEGWEIDDIVIYASFLEFLWFTPCAICGASFPIQFLSLLR